MDLKEFEQKLVEKISNPASKIYKSSIVGCDSHDIEIIEKKHPGKLPEIYKIFLRHAGKHVGNKYYEAAVCVDHLERMRANAKRILEQGGSYANLLDSNFVFYETHGDFFALFSTKTALKNDDPPVYTMWIPFECMGRREMALSEFILDDFQRKDWSVESDKPDPWDTDQ